MTMAKFVFTARLGPFGVGRPGAWRTIHIPCLRLPLTSLASPLTYSFDAGKNNPCHNASMTEIFGATAAALGVAGLFNNCVACFEYIQLGRHFGEDFERCQLKLDLARNRLGRWGQMVDIGNNPVFQSDDDETSRQAHRILGHIINQLSLAYDKSKRYEAGKSQESLVTFGEDDMRPVT